MDIFANDHVIAKFTELYDIDHQDGFDIDLEAPIESSEPNMSHDQTKDINQEYVQQDNEAKTLYQLGSSIFVKAGFLADENITSDSIHIPNDGLASCFQNNKYPIANRIFQSMQYQGKGLGIHEQGILEPIQLQEN